MDSVLIPRDLLVAMTVICRRVSRSLDLALHSEWSDLKSYFKSLDFRIYQFALKEMKSLLPQPDEEFDPTLPDPPSWIIALKSRLMFEFRGQISIPSTETRWIAGSLEHGLRLVQMEVRPGDQEIVTGRTRLAQSEYLLGRRIPKAIAQQAERVQHFNAPSHLTMIPMEEFLRRHAPRYLDRAGQSGFAGRG